MFSKAIFLCLGTVLILQNCNAKPYKDMDSAIRALTERLQLLRIVHNGFENITRKVMRDSVVVIEKMLKDPKILEIKSDSMQSKLDEFRDFIKTFEEFDKIEKSSKDEIQEVVKKFDRVVNKYEEKEGKTLEDAEDKIIGDFLKENNFVRFQQDSMMEIAKPLLDKIIAEVEKYLDGLNETEKEDESRLVELMEEIKDDTDTKRRFELMMLFIERCDLEHYLW